MDTFLKIISKNILLNFLYGVTNNKMHWVSHTKHVLHTIGVS